MFTIPTSNEDTSFSFSPSHFTRKFILDCCTFRNDIPSELQYIIKSYLHDDIDDTNIRQAVTEWLQDPVAATLRYDHISKWDTSLVTDMSALFHHTDINDDISQWNTSSVITMESMFEGCIAFNRDVSLWDVSKVKNMRSMFAYAMSFDQRLNDWDVSNVTDMCGMFYEANYFNQPLNQWDVSKVTNMNSMFSKAYGFNQRLDMWDISSITEMNDMFFLCKAMQYDYLRRVLEDWPLLTHDSTMG